jgi:molybdopterin-biosynthesis enzyme MoeA-like protein
MIVELVCVGSELLSGITLNSNAHWLAGQIAQSGGILRRVTVVKDDLGEISAAVRESLARSPELLITTGGLGRKTSVDQKAVEMLKRSYARRGLDYELNEVRLKMATIPDGSTPLENMVGSAPAVKIELEKSGIFCLQGVPGEMQQIFNDYILPVIKKKVGHFFSKEVNCMVRGVTESMIAPALQRIVDSNPGDALYLKTHPQGYGENNVPQIRAQVVTRGTDEGEVAKRLDAIVATLQQEISKLGGKIVS